MRYAIAIFTALAAAFISVGVNQALEQHQRLSVAQATLATVTASEVRTVATPAARGRSNTTYRPSVRFQYRAGTSIIGGDQVFPTGSTTTRRRAEQIVADHPEGKAVTVWLYDPRDPTRAFLLREWDFGPYLTILFCMIHLCVGLGLWTAAPWRRNKVRPPKPAQGPWHELEVRVTLAARRHPWRAVTLVWFVLGGIALGHYFANADRPYATEALIAAPIYLAVGLVPLAMYLYHLRAARTARDAKVLINAATIRPGRTFDVKLEQTFHRPAHIEALRIGLICERTTRLTRKNKSLTRTAIEFETWNEVKTDQQVGPTRPLEARAKLTPPTDITSLPPTARWKIVIELKIKNRPDHRAEYPIAAEA